MIEIVHAKLHNVFAGSGCARPFLFLIVGVEQCSAFVVYQLFGVGIGVSVGQRTGSESQCKSACGQASTLCWARTVLAVAPSILYFLGGLHHFAANIVGHLFIRAARSGYLFVTKSVINAFVGHDWHWTIAAEQQPIKVSTYKTRLAFKIEPFFLGHFGVPINVGDEHRSLINALVTHCPAFVKFVFAIFALHERVVRKLVELLRVVVDVAVAIVHVVGEGKRIGFFLFANNIGVLVFQERIGVGKPLLGAYSAGEDLFNRDTVLKVFVGVQIVVATGKECSDAQCQRYQGDIFTFHDVCLWL